MNESGGQQRPVKRRPTSHDENKLTETEAEKRCRQEAKAWVSSTLEGQAHLRLHRFKQLVATPISRMIYPHPVREDADADLVEKRQRELERIRCDIQDRYFAWLTLTLKPDCWLGAVSSKLTKNNPLERWIGPLKAGLEKDMSSFTPWARPSRDGRYWTDLGDMLIYREIQADKSAKAEEAARAGKDKPDPHISARVASKMVAAEWSMEWARHEAIRIAAGEPASKKRRWTKDGDYLRRADKRSEPQSKLPAILAMIQLDQAVSVGFGTAFTHWRSLSYGADWPTLHFLRTGDRTAFNLSLDTDSPSSSLDRIWRTHEAIGAATDELNLAGWMDSNRSETAPFRGGPATHDGGRIIVSFLPTFDAACAHRAEHCRPGAYFVRSAASVTQ